ncbi:hypothetical protein [Nocardia testacea]|uniref:hypothetical protein n=1 Tax=Nocardia testacea TaxID=248551 RepID=UPI0002E64D9B|nr:hypothetical protein [Nocardia testacea]
MICIDLRLPLGVRLHIEVRRGPDPLDIVTAVWSERYREPPYCDDHQCDCP